LYFSIHNVIALSFKESRIDKPKKRLTPKCGVSYDLQYLTEVKPQKTGVSHELLCRIGCFFGNNFAMHH
jgi:hypothetical protein